MEDLGTSGSVRPASSDGPPLHGTGHPTSRCASFRPSRWSWTTSASVLLLIGLTFLVASATADVAAFLERALPGSRAGVAEVIGRGWVLAGLPCAIAILAVWRLRRRGDEEDLRSAAALGVAAVTVPGLGLLIGLAQVPHHPEPRLVLLIATFVVGVVLLGCSLWLRHVPRS